MLGLPLDIQAEVQAATGVKRHEPKPIGKGHKAWLKRAIPGLSEADQALANDLFGFKDPDEKWFTNLRAVAFHWEQCGKLPSQMSTGESESQLGRWVSTQRKNTDLTPERRASIMEHCPAILLENFKDTWGRTLVEVAAYWEQHGNLPSTMASDESERRLGRWVSNQRQSGSLTPERRASIMEQCPAVLLENFKDIWGRTLVEVATYWEQHGKLPSKEGSDETERRLGSWVSRQRKSKGLTPERRAMIMEQCPEILLGDLEGVWDRTLVDVAAHWEQHRKLPSQRSSDESESRLGRWINSQRNNKNLAPERRVAIIEQCPEILVENLEGVWDRTLVEVAAHWEQHGKLPMARSRDESERRLGRWVGTQRRIKSLTPERRAAIMEHCPEILVENFKDVWGQLLTEVAKHWGQHGKLPSTMSADESLRKLGRWVSTQRKNKDLTTGRRASIMEQCPAILEDPNPDTWGQNLAKISEYWRKNGKLPSTMSADESLRKLGNWVSTQRQNNKLTLERRTAIMEHCPAILVDGTSILNKAWEHQLSEVAEYCRQNGKLPSQHSDDESVKGLGAWIGKQRNNKNLSPKRVEEIMEQCPEVLANTKSGAWEQSLSETAEHWRQIGKLPSQHSVDEAAKKLGNWVSKQRQNKKLTPERRAEIMEQCPAILEDTSADAWERNLTETIEYLRKQGKLPSEKSQEGHIKSLGNWVSKQRQNKNLSPERRAAIMDQCPAILAGR